MRTRGALRLHFRSDDAEVHNVVAKRFECIAKRLSKGDEYFRCDADDVRCKKEDPPIAHTKARPDADIYLCNKFFEIEDDVKRGMALIHELAHNFGASHVVTDEARRKAPKLFGHLDPSQLQHEVYKFHHEYRALGARDAVATADAYPYFALDNDVGAGWSMSLLPEMIEVRSGISRLPQTAQIAVSVRTTWDLGPTFLQVFSPVLGVEFGLDLRGRKMTFDVAATAGMFFRNPGDPLYLDLRVGPYLSYAHHSDPHVGLLWDASVHMHQGIFDVSAFWKQYQPFAAEGRTVIGVGFNVSDMLLHLPH